MSSPTISPNTIKNEASPGLNKDQAKKNIVRLLLHAILLFLTLSMIAPFLWMVLSSLKTQNELFQVPPTFFPEKFMWQNYVYMFENAPWSRYFFNTTKITFFVVFGQMIACSMGAYAFARLKFPGRDVMFFIYLGTMMIPYHVTMIPTFKIIKELGWLNTHYALIVPAIFAYGAFGTFLLRQFFLTIPKELEEAAKIDGCSYPRIYWNIILPISRPALTTLAIFAFMATWNDFLAPLIYINSDELKTLTLGLATFQGTYATQWNQLMAGALIISVPVVLLFIFAQRFFIEGIAMSGSKE